MQRGLSFLVLFVFLLGAGSPTARSRPDPVRAGEMLPEGATQRLGSADFRLGQRALRFVLLPDGKHALNYRPRSLELWSLETGRLVGSADTPGQDEPPAEWKTGGTPGSKMAPSPDGKSVVLLWNGRGYRYAVPPKGPPEPLPSVGESESLLAVTFTDSTEIVVGVTSTNRVTRWKQGEKDWTTLRPGVPGKVRFTAVGGGVLATATEDNKVRVWDATKGKELETLTVPDLWSLAVSPNGQLLGMSSGKVRPDTKYLVEVRSTADGRRISSWESRSASLLAFSPDATQIASQEGMHIELREVKTGARTRTISVLGDDPRHMQYLPDGNGLVSVGDLGLIAVWDPRTGKALRPVAGHAGRIRAVVSIPAGGWITAGDDGTIRRWDASGKETGRFEGHTREVTGLAISADGKALFSGSFDGTVRAWDVEKGTELRRNGDAALTDQLIQALALSPDGKALATCAGFSIRLLDATSLKQTAILNGDEKGARFHGVAFLADGRLAARAGSVIHVWNTPVGNEAYRLDQKQRVGGSATTVCLAASPDGKRFVTPLDHRLAGKDRPVYLGVCEAQTGKILDQIEVGKRAEAVLTAAVYTPDGKTAVVGDAAGRVWVIDLEKKAVRKTFEGHRGAVTCLAVSADGKSVASGGADTTALVWDLTKP